MRNGSVATGVYGYSYIYPHNQSKYTFYGVKLTSERLLNIKFYTSSKNFIQPPKKQISGAPDAEKTTLINNLVKTTTLTLQHDDVMFSRLLMIQQQRVSRDL